MRVFMVILWSECLRVSVIYTANDEKACVTKECRNCLKKTCLNEVSTCTESSSKCVCNHCWKGQSCETYVNLYPPQFKTPIQYVRIKQNEKIAFQLSAYDKDSWKCEDQTNCRCGDIVYKLVNDNPYFFVSKDKVLVKDISKVNLFSYYLEVIAFNPPRLRNYTNRNYFSIQKIFIDIVNDIEKPKQTRLRRATSDVNNSSIDGTISLAAVPYLSSTYYFNKGDLITFLLSATFNASYNLSSVTDLKVLVSSQWLDLQDPVNISFTSVSKENESYSFKIQQFFSGTLYGNITGKVKDNIEPLSSLFLSLNALYRSPNERSLSSATYESHPVVYGVFPFVNLIRNQTGIIKVYSSVQFNMNIMVPLLNFTLLAEITTNIEDFVFMSISNVNLKTGSDVKYNGSSSFDFYSSQGNSNFDRASVDLGYITVSKNSFSVDRLINISFLVNVDDHVNVVNGTTHLLGIGIQTGANVLWVEQQSIQVLKVEPVLDVQLTVTLTNSSYVYINDILNITFTIFHTLTSLSAAYDVKVDLFVQHLAAVSETLVRQNDTCYSVLIKSTKPLIENASITGSFLMKGTSDITPLANLTVNMVVNYKNAEGMQKPKASKFINLVAGSPVIYFKYFSPQETSSHRSTFVLIVILRKLQSNLFFEFGISNTNYSALGILNVRLESVGSNIVGVNTSAVPTYLSTTGDKKFWDLVFLDLGTALNANENLVDLVPENQVVIKFDTIASEQQIATNNPNVWVKVSMSDKNLEIWNSQLQVNTYVVKTPRPHLSVSYKGFLDGNTINVSLAVSHLNDSTQNAYNLTFEYFLPPFVIFDSEEKFVVNNVQKSNSNFLQYKLTEALTFFDTITHSFNAKLDQLKVPSSDSFILEISLKIDFINFAGKKWSQFKTYKQTIFLLSYKPPLIPKDSQALPESYGRGIYWDAISSHIYVCMNQHVDSYKAACYFSKNEGLLWAGLDVCVGSVIGHYSLTKELCGIHRNQKTYLKFHSAHGRWIALTNEDFSKNVAKNLNQSLWKKMEGDEDQVFNFGPYNWMGKYFCQF